MKFTGERFVPAATDSNDEIVFEHLHRYQSAMALVQNKRVLDIACGEGYGAALLATKAAAVTGVDIDEECIKWAIGRYAGNVQNLDFRCGSATAIPLGDQSFDIVISYETIEHLDAKAQQAFMKEIKRVLVPGGMLIMSTPDKKNYSDRFDHANPFHLHEFYRDDFVNFIRDNFSNSIFLEQGYQVVSIISNAAAERAPVINIQQPGEGDPAKSIERKYIIAIASDKNITEAGTALSSVLINAGKDYLAIMERLVAMNSEIEKLGEWGHGLDNTTKKLQAVVNEYKTRLQETDSTRKKEIAEKNLLLEELHARQHQLYQDLNATKERLSEIYSSDGWKLLNRYYRIKGKLLPEHSGRYKKLKKLVQHLRLKPYRAGSQPAQPSRAAFAPALPTRFDPLTLPVYETPAVSIIIPAHNAWAMNYQCISSIIQHTHGTSYEVILADDCSTDATKDCGTVIRHLIHQRNETNLGFLKNCNNAAKLARGKYILLLNNDTTVTPNWLQPLVSLAESNDRIGMTGPKLIYPDGRLQEAGGIIWNDASGWNYGHLQDPQLPEFNYVKEVDYISGACILIRRNAWEKAGGFDERYSPAYCEDSDFAFTLRSMNYTVMYQPQSEVIHYEGFSHGNDATLTENPQSIKSYQQINNRQLREKWKQVLENEQFPNGRQVFHARDRSGGKKTMLVIDHYVPHIDKDAGSKTTFQYLELFTTLGLNVKFIGDNFFKHEPYTTTLQQMGIEVLYGPWYCDNWQQWIKTNADCIDYVLLNRPHISVKYIDFIKANTQACILYYGHDLHFLREEMKFRVDGDARSREAAKKWKQTEMDLFSKSDIVLTPSHEEQQIIAALDQRFRAETILPYIFKQPAVAVEDFSLRQDILFVGGFNHTPNADAVHWFCREVWPAVVAAIPAASFIIVGSNPPESILQLQGGNIVIKGFVSEKELQAIYQKVKLAVIPLRYGAGVKGKTIEAIQQGLPIVTTGFGIEGMPGEYLHFLHPKNTAQEFAEETIRLYNNNEVLQKMSVAGIQYINENFTSPIAAAKMKDLLGI